MVMQTQVPHGWGAAAQRQRRDKDSTAWTKDKASNRTGDGGWGA